MRSSTDAKIGSVVAAATCVGIAGAQTSGISARLGAFFPTNSSASDLGRSWVAFGLDFKLRQLNAKVPVTGTQSYFGISADYYAHGGDNDIPVALTYNLRQAPFTFSAGIGPDFRDASDLVDTGVGFSEQVGVAYDISKGPMPIFIQAKYFFASKPELSGIGVYIGARF